MATGALAHLRFPVEQSRGRRYPEPPHPYRNDFQRDRDRIVHARAFRRLEDKTQVFGPGLSDHFRNRLTHTIEVAQIARTAASILQLNADLTEALALAHDIGHPPFAHAGEHELDRQMRRFGDRFDHNAHALRIVEHVENRYARFPGLNLTFEVREGMVKHSRDFDPGEAPGFDAYLPGYRPPLEAQLIDLADEIAYNAADLDDAYAAGILTMDDIAAEVPGYSDLRDTVQTQFAGAAEPVQFNEVLRLLIDRLVSGMIEGTWRSAAAISSVEEVRTHAHRLAGFDEESAQLNRGLKTLLHQRVYESEALVRERAQSTGMIAELFDFYLSHPERLPRNNSEQPLHRTVCDYIAGMTDGYFRRVHKELLVR